PGPQDSTETVAERGVTHVPASFACNSLHLCVWLQASVRPTVEVAKMPEIRTPKSAAEDLTKAAKDAFYVSIGLAVIAFQKAQVQRQELRRQGTEQVGDAKPQIQSLAKVFEDRVK